MTDSDLFKAASKALVFPVIIISAMLLIINLEIDQLKKEVRFSLNESEPEMDYKPTYADGVSSMRDAVQPIVNNFMRKHGLLTADQSYTIVINSYNPLQVYGKVVSDIGSSQEPH